MWLLFVLSLPKPLLFVVVVGICRKNGGAGATVRIGDDDSHNLQEYTYKKITPCDVCSQVLRGEFAFNTKQPHEQISVDRTMDVDCMWGREGAG